MTAGGLIAGFVIALGAGVVARATELKEDASLAAFFLISLAVGVTIVSLKGNNVDLLHFLFGTVLALDDPTLLLIAGDHDASRSRVLARDLPAAGARMRRSGLPALGQPRRRAGAYRVPGAGGDESRRRLPCARHAARRRHHDAARRDRALLGARHHRDDPDRGRERRARPAMRACCVSFHTGAPSGPAIILVAGALYAASVLFGPPAGWSASSSPDAISKPEATPC